MQYNLKTFIDRPEKRNLFLFIFLIIWLALNLAQAYFTELAHDEAYYWMYSRNLAWGYFDHPPVIALLIKAGYSLFPNELGVRLFTAILGTLTIWVIYLIIDEEVRSLWLFILITSSIILVFTHVGGFLAIPDIPIVFFTSLFFLIYKKYLANDTYYYAILIGVVASLMLYSKYHGILIMGFTLLANIKIMSRRSFWLIPIITLVALLPHLLWQIHNGFPTFQYHLISRSSPYKVLYTINYLYSQLLIAGPLAGIFILYAAIRCRPVNTFNRILKVNMIAILVFFFISSFKGRVEAHWTAVAYIPIIVLAFYTCQHNKKVLTWIKRMYIPTFALFIFLRIALVVEIFPARTNIGQELHNWDTWAQQIDSVADGRKVVFMNTFQRAAKYSFYTDGKFAHSVNNIFYRKNQYDIWPYEDSVQNQNVILFEGKRRTDTIQTATGEEYSYAYINNFHSYQDIQIKISETEYAAPEGDSIDLDVEVLNPRKYEVQFEQGTDIFAAFTDNKTFWSWHKLMSLSGIELAPGGAKKYKLHILTPKKEGHYYLYLSINTSTLYAAFNSPLIKIRIF